MRSSRRCQTITWTTSVRSEPAVRRRRITCTTIRHTGTRWSKNYWI